jgi:hypothetical protein
MKSPPKTVEIRLAVRSVDELLDSRSSPLLTPRIHSDVARAIRSAASESPRTARFQIIFEVPEDDLARAAEVSTATHAHFAEEESCAIDDLRAVTEKGLRGFVLALFIVAALVLASEAISQLTVRRIAGIVSESLIILAWVTLWSPSETLLFGRFPPIRAKMLAKRLVSAPVQLVVRPPASCQSGNSGHLKHTPC